MQDPNQPTHISPDGLWAWDGAKWVPRYQGGADIPAQSPVHYSAAPSRRTGGIGAGVLAAVAAAWAYGKYVFLVLLKFPAMATLLTGLLSFGVYALIYPWQVAIGVILMFFVHEMGHVVEIRRQGMQATAPIFIPLFGAAIFQRSHATTPMRQAQIGIAGPIAGTLFGIVSVVLYAATNNHIYLFWAYFAFLINLFNLIPFGMLDGGWILAPVSKWIQLGGLGLLVVLFLIGVVNPLVVLIVALGIPMVFRRFRDSAYDAYLTQGPLNPRLAMGMAWLALVVILGIGLFQTEQLAAAFVR